jgi:hypothetical protein
MAARTNLDPAAPGSPAKPSRGEEKACGVACRIGVGVENSGWIESVSKVYRFLAPGETAVQLPGQAVPRETRSFLQ